MFYKTLTFFIVCFVPLFANGAEKVLNIGNGPDPYSIDPHLASNVSEYKVISALFECLIIPHPETLAPVPGVAESWTISEDNRTYTFNIRTDAKWSDGTAITAQDFVFSVKRALSRGLGCPNVDMFFDIKNAKNYFNYNITDFAEVGIKAVDEHTLEIKLEHDVPYFLSLVMTPVWSPINEKCILANGAIDDRNNKWARAKNIVSNGPFSLKKWNIGNSLITIKNKNYWDAKNVQCDVVKFYCITDPTTEERMFLNGDIDITEVTSFTSLKSGGIDRDVVHVTPYLGCFFYTFNTQNKFLSNVNIRRALSLAIDRKALLETLGEPNKLSATGLIPPGTANFEQQTCFESDLELARKLLSESGLAEELREATQQLFYNSAMKNKTVAEFVQESWKKNLGINVELRGQEWKTFVVTRKLHEFDIARGGWIGDFNDPTTFLNLFVSGGLQNHGQWSNKEYDAAIEQSNAEGVSRQQRVALLKKAEQILIDNMAIMPLYYESSHHLVSKNVIGWHENILDIHPFKFMDLAE